MSEFMSTNRYKEYHEPKTEYLAGAEDIDGLTESYNQLSAAAVERHRWSFSNIAFSYIKQIVNANSKNAESTIEEVFRLTEKATIQTLSVDAVKAVVEEASSRAFCMLPEADKRIVSQITTLISRKKRWLGSYEVKELKRQIEDSESKKKSKLCFDLITFGVVQQEKVLYGPASTHVGMAVDYLSSPEVKNLVKGSLDADILERIQQSTQRYGVSSTNVKVDIGSASDRSVRDTFRLSLDREVLSQAKNSASVYGLEGFETTHILDRASSPQVRALIENLVKESLSATEEHEEGQPHEDLEAKRIVAKVVNGDGSKEWPARRSVRWLLEEDPIDIRRVINTVKTLRQNRGLSDRDIYIRYRKNIEKSEGDKDNPVDPRLQKSFSILNALMGGVSGKLPF